MFVKASGGGDGKVVVGRRIRFRACLKNIYGVV